MQTAQGIARTTTLVAMILPFLIKDAVASTTHYDPFGSSANTQAVIGSDLNDGWSQWIGWKNKDTGECAWTYLGGGGGWELSFWADDIYVMMLGGNDSVMIPNLPITFCGFEVRAPLLNHHILGANGGDGNDVLISLVNPGAPDELGLSGGSGDDLLYTNRNNNGLWGDDGNDTLVNVGGGSGGDMEGWSGNDCLYYYQSPPGAPGPLMNCGEDGGGADLDYWAGASGYWVSPECEQMSSNCCGYGCGAPPPVPSW